MSVEPTADRTTLRDPVSTKRRAGPVAMALVALGAPLALAAPAVANDDGPAHAADGHKGTPHAEPTPAAAVSVEAQADASVGAEVAGDGKAGGGRTRRRRTRRRRHADGRRRGGRRQLGERCPGAEG